LSFRFQPPVHSPITAGALIRAVARASRAPDEAVRELADELRTRFAADEVVLTGSGTQALQMAIQTATADAGRDGIVALPGFCCYDVARAAIGADRQVVLYDLDPATLTPDLTSLEAAFRAGAQAAVIAPLYGVPAPWEPIASLAREYGVTLIEDAAQGQGARWRNAPLGSLGEISILSFGRGKGWTGGGGGALLLRGTFRGKAIFPATAGGGRLAGSVGAIAQWMLARPSIYGIPRSIPALGLGETRYHAPDPTASISPFSAALAMELSGAAIAEAEHRGRVGEMYLKALSARRDAQAPLLDEAASPGWLRFPVRVRGGAAALAGRMDLLRLGIGQSYPSTLAELGPLADRIVLSQTPLPGAAELVRDLITLPTHSVALKSSDQESISTLSNLHGLSHSA
jgi:dTDP-4-amino-4,6-dideoxygalactose transaminase